MSDTIVITEESVIILEIAQQGPPGAGGGGGGGAVESVAGKTGIVILNKNDVGLSLVDNTSDAAKPVSTAQATALAGKAATAHTQGISTIIGLQAALDSKPTLDGGGLVPAINLPSYVDDVLEYATLAAFPAIGEPGKIYIAATPTGAQYRWTGSAYAEMIQSPGTTDAVAEGASNLYFTAARVRATVLTGLSLAVNSAVVAGDTALAAIGKIQRQINDFLISTNIWTKNQSVTPVVLASGATVNTNAALSNNFRLVLATNATLANPTNLTDGMVLNFYIKQDATGSRTLAFGTMFKFPGAGTAPTLSTAAAAVDFMSGYYDATDGVIRCSFLKGST